MSDLDRDVVIDLAASVLLERLSAAGITGRPVLLDFGKALMVGEEGWLNLENLADELLSQAQEDWKSTVERWADFAIRSSTSTPIASMDAVEFRARVRSRVLPDEGRYEYGRPIAEGLILVLCLDFPDSVATISDKDIDTLPIPVDEAFEVGRRNTALEPIDEVWEQDDVWFAVGDSMFIASKMADVPSLIQQLELDAADGLLLAVPGRSVLMYKIPTRESGVTDLISMAMAVDMMTAGPDAPDLDGMVSDQVWYWSPAGTLTSLSGDPSPLPGGEGLAVRPSEEFKQRFMDR